MSDKWLKEELKNAYVLDESDSGKKFIHTYQKRSCSFLEIFQIELRYMGLKSLIAFVVLFIFSFSAVRYSSAEGMWIIASFLPLCSVLPMTLLQRSELYQMDEIETASRFSIRFIRLIRMLVLGTFSILAIGMISLLLKKESNTKPIEILIYMLIPYLINIAGGLIITRYSGRKESTFGVAAIGALSAFVPSLMRQIQSLAVLSDYIYIVVLIGLLIVTARECIEYVNERTNILWNLY